MNIRLMCCSTMLVGLVSVVQAAGERVHGGRGHWRHRFLERFDTDGDGKLSEQERTAARDALWNELNRAQVPGAEEIDFKRLAEEFRKLQGAVDDAELIKRFRDVLENGKLLPWLEGFKRRGGGGDQERRGDRVREEKQEEPARKEKKEKKEKQKETRAQPDPVPLADEKKNTDPLVNMLDKLGSQKPRSGDKAVPEKKRPKKDANLALGDEEDDEESGLRGKSARVPPPLFGDVLAGDDLVISRRVP